MLRFSRSFSLTSSTAPCLSQKRPEESGDKVVAVVAGTALHILHWWGLTSVDGASPYGNCPNLEFSHGKILKFIASEMAGNASKV